jgi:hypothetical protein
MNGVKMNKLKMTNFLKGFLAQLLVLVIGTFFVQMSAADDAATSTDNQTQTKLKVRSQLRELGYTIGDVADQTLTITTPLGYVFDRGSLPAIGANSSPVELVSVEVTEKDSQQSTQHIVHLRWQHFRSMQEIRYYALKPLILKFTHEDKKPLSIPIAAGRILVAPVIPTVIAGDSYKNLRPDVKPQQKELSRHILLLALMVSCVIACLAYLAWYFDWFNWRLARLRPFRKAYREIRQLGNQDIQLPVAIRYLRRGFDGVAGAAVSAESLASLFHSKNWLTPAKKEIEGFFADSERVFFAGQQSIHSLQQLRKLSQRLMQLESAATLITKKNTA